MTQQVQSAEEKARLKKQWTDLAIQQALASQWEEAVATNRNILNIFPMEPDAYNRYHTTWTGQGAIQEFHWTKVLRCPVEKPAIRPAGK